MNLHTTLLRRFKIGCTSNQTGPITNRIWEPATDCSGRNNSQGIDGRFGKSSEQREGHTQKESHALEFFRSPATEHTIISSGAALPHHLEPCPFHWLFSRWGQGTERIDESGIRSTYSSSCCYAS